MDICRLCKAGIAHGACMCRTCDRAEHEQKTLIARAAEVAATIKHEDRKNDRPIVGPNAAMSSTDDLEQLWFGGVKPLTKKKASYASLHNVLMAAYRQSSTGKGEERHNPNNLPFEEQEIVQIGVRFRNLGFQLGQASKKLQEGEFLPPQQQVHELLGVINYVAAAILVLEKLHPDQLLSDSVYTKFADIKETSEED